MTKKKLEETLKNIDADDEQKKKIVCSLIGHSNILEYCFGYHHCHRCEEMLGDSLGGAYHNDSAVYVGHECEICDERKKKLTWKDKFMINMEDV